MRIGLIARPEISRGLGIQTQAIARELGVHAVLVIDINDGYKQGDGRIAPEGAEERWAEWDARRSCISSDDLEWIFRMCDVLISVETFYDQRLVKLAPRYNVTTVLIGNPEFFRSEAPRAATHWWPTAWLQEKLPKGPIMPHPAEPGVVEQTLYEGGPLKVFHAVGRPALEDRNGTEFVLKSLEYIEREVEFTIFTMGDLPFNPKVLALPDNVTLRVVREEIDDRWDVYRGQHVMVLPRRYGGLCLPAIEAASAGCALMMTDCSPNLHAWPIVALPAMVGGMVRVPFGEVRRFDTSGGIIGHAIDDLAAKPHRVQEFQNLSLAWAKSNSWDYWRPRWISELERAL